MRGLNLRALKIALGLGIASGALCQSASSDALAPSPEALGLRIERFASAGGRLTTTVRELKSGLSQTSIYSPLGRLEGVATSTAAGRLIERREFRGDEQAHEVFAPKHVLTLTYAAGPKADQVQRTVFDSRGKARTWTFFRERDRALQCGNLVPGLSEGWMDAIASLSWITRLPLPEKITMLGDEDLRVDVIGCEQYEGGTAQLATDFSNAMTRGLSCLAGFGGQRALDAGRIMDLLRRPKFLPDGSLPARATPTIRCGRSGERVKIKGHYVKDVDSDALAEALGPEDPGFPGMLINLSTASDNAERREATLFHETLHWLGYVHGEGVDPVYLSTYCCFPMGRDPQDRQKRACDLLRAPGDWRSPEYQTTFSRILAGAGHAYPPIFHTAWSALMDAPPPSPSSVRDTRGLMAAALVIGQNVDPNPRTDRIIRKTSSPFAGLILLSAALSGSEQARLYGDPAVMRTLIQRDYYPETDPELRPKREFALAVGKVLGEMILGDGTRAVERAKRILKSAKENCARLEENERDQIRHAIASTKNSMYAVAPDSKDATLQAWFNLCEKPKSGPDHAKVGARLDRLAL